MSSSTESEIHSHACRFVHVCVQMCTCMCLCARPYSFFTSLLLCFFIRPPPPISSFSFAFHSIDMTTDIDTCQKHTESSSNPHIELFPTILTFWHLNLEKERFQRHKSLGKGGCLCTNAHLAHQRVSTLSFNPSRHASFKCAGFCRPARLARLRLVHCACIPGMKCHLRGCIDFGGNSLKGRKFL